MRSHLRRCKSVAVDESLRGGDFSLKILHNCISDLDRCFQDGVEYGHTADLMDANGVHRRLTAEKRWGKRVTNGSERTKREEIEGRAKASRGAEGDLLPKKLLSQMGHLRAGIAGQN